MNEQTDVTLETDHMEEVIESRPPGQPVVVIQYRSRGLPWYVVATLLVVAMGAAIAIYDSVVASRDRRVPPMPTAPNATSEGAGTLLAGTDKPVPVGGSLLTTASGVALNADPLSLNTQPIRTESPSSSAATNVMEQSLKPADAAPASMPLPQPPAEPKIAGQVAAAPKVGAPAYPPAATVAKNDSSPSPPATPGATERPEHKKTMALGFSPPSDDESPFAAFPLSPKAPDPPLSQDPNEAPGNRPEAAAPDQRPAPTKEELEQQIKAEAAEKDAERRQLRDLKDQARIQVDAESLRKVDEERATFRRQLNAILQSRSSQAGKQIDDLCNQFGRAYDTELRTKVTHKLARLSGKTSLDTKVRLLRDFGVPEAAILDFLANEIHFYVNTRNGPTGPNEVRVRAARQLLRIKLVKSPEGAPRGLNPPTGTAGSTSCHGASEDSDASAITEEKRPSLCSRSVGLIP